MIHSFGDERTELIFDGISVKKLSDDLQKQTRRRLYHINSADKLDDLRVSPSNRLERKQGDLKDFYAIWVNKQWRIIFKWDNGAYDVQLIDYH